MGPSRLAAAGLALTLAGLALICLALTSPVVEEWQVRSVSPTPARPLSVSRAYEVVVRHDFPKGPESYRGVAVTGYLRTDFPLDLVVEANGRALRLRNLMSYEINMSVSVEDARRGIRVRLVNEYTRNVTGHNLLAGVLEVSRWLNWTSARVDLTDEVADAIWESVRGLGVEGFSFRVLNVTLYGRAVEASGAPFNLYVLSDEEYKRFAEGQPFRAYYAAKGRSSYRFSVNVSAEVLHFVIERTEPQGELVVEEGNLTVELPEGLAFTKRELRLFKAPPETRGPVSVTLSLAESRGRPFNAYVAVGGELRFAGRGRSHYVAKLSLSRDECSRSISLVIERAAPGELEVAVRVVREWRELPPRLEVLLVVNASYARVVWAHADFHIALTWRERVERRALDHLLPLGEAIALAGAVALALSRLAVKPAEGD